MKNSLLLTDLPVLKGFQIRIAKKLFFSAIDVVSSSNKIKLRATREIVKNRQHICREATAFQTTILNWNCRSLHNKSRISFT